MGGGSSTATAQARALGKHENEIVRLMMPIYYTSDDVTPEERKVASDSWHLILNDITPEFDTRKRSDPEFKFDSSVTFFYDSFYARLFDIHPMSRELFKSGMKAQGKFLVKMISLSLSELDNPDKFNASLVKLAEIHYHRGVKASEYGIVGEVLFWALRLVIGYDVYTDEMHSAWVKVYSRMLRIIVPVAISWELQLGSTIAQSSRVSSSRSRTVDSAYSALSSSTLLQRRLLPPPRRSPQARDEEAAVAGGGRGGGGSGEVAGGEGDGGGVEMAIVGDGDHDDDDDNGNGKGERIAEAEPATMGKEHIA